MHIIQRLTVQFLNKIYTVSKDTIANVPKLKMYVPLPFYDAPREAEAVELLQKLSNWYQQVSFTSVLKTITPFPKCLATKIKFRIVCAPRWFINSNVKAATPHPLEAHARNLKFKARISQHLGISDRSGL